jgi:hypothetical protein
MIKKELSAIVDGFASFGAFVMGYACLGKFFDLLFKGNVSTYMGLLLAAHFVLVEKAGEYWQKAKDTHRYIQAHASWLQNH